VTGAPAAGWDEIIVGAGSAGAVLAARLAGRGDRRVLLIEAGVEEDDGTGPVHPVGAPTVEGRNWDHTAWIGAEGSRRQYPYRVGRGLGGSSAVNGAIALRGLPVDFDTWADLGNPEWEWKQVLGWFGPPGADGPVPIERPAAGDLSPAARVFLDACRSAGLPYLDDLDDGDGPGVGLVPSNTRDGRRMSSALTHLQAVRSRPTLSVLTGGPVRRVLLDGHRAVGVEVDRDGRAERIAGGRVTLCAGAIGTPLILLRSGIGAVDQLERAGVRVRVELPGVGRNLADHPAVAIWALPRPGVAQAGKPWHEVMARLAVDGPDPDVSLFLAGNVATGGLPGVGAALAGRTAMSVSTVLLSPVSRGEVRLREDDPDGPPRIALRLAEAEADRRRLAAGVRVAWSLLTGGPFAGLTERVLAWTGRMVGDDAMLDSAIGRFVCPLWHPVGTARMGPAGDPLAVVDQRLRVHGVDGLAVVDASVMPTIPRAPTNLTCMAIAERAAAWTD
jgi:choline dehydrogenase